ncbi:MAG TPA: RNA polymerase subunit sigma-70 [Polyangiaceae bacterium]
MARDFEAELGEHRPDLLRHCYRMLGAFADAEDVVQDVLANAWKSRASFSGDVPIRHWLMRMATNACLNELGRRKRRTLPQLEREAATSFDVLEEVEASTWITPAPDSRLFGAAPVLEARETVALAFIALLQRLPPRQRAALLLKDVVGFSTDEIATALETTVPSIESALHRAREGIALPRPTSSSRNEPSASTLRAYVRSWEERDLDTLVGLLKDDAVFAMPPHSVWVRGSSVGDFFRSPKLAPFWARTTRVLETRANDGVALAFYTLDGDTFVRHSVQLARFDGDRLAEGIQFIGARYLEGFDVPERFAR